MVGRYLTNEDVALLTQKADIEPPNISPYSVAAGSVGSIAAIINNIQTMSNLDVMKGNMPTWWGAQLVTAKNLAKLSTDFVPVEISSRLNGDWTKIIDGLKTGIAGGVGSLFSSMYEINAGTGHLVQAYNGLIQQIGINPWIVRYLNETLHTSLPDARTAWYMNRIGLINNTQKEILTKWDGWDTHWHGILSEAWTATLPIDALINLWRRKAIDLNQYKHEMHRNRFNDSQIAYTNSLLIEQPEPYRVAEMGARDLATEQETADTFQWWGLESKWAPMWTESQRTRPSVGMIADMFWRGKITKDEALLQLRRTGYPTGYDENIMATFDQIPPAQDIITMVVREAFEASNIVKAPSEFTGWIAKKGFNEYWADKYWTAHFTPIALQYAYDNLRRGYHDETWFKEVLRIADIHPRWHDDILKVAYNPPAIRELGYGFDVGIYTRDDIVKYRRWGGLALEDAEKAADSLIDYRLEAERNAIRTAYMNLFINNAITEIFFRQKLAYLRTNELAIELWVERAKANIQLKEVNTPITESKTVTRADGQFMFENGLRDEDWLRARLDQIGYSADSIQMYVEQSKYRIEQKKPKPEVIEPKTPTLAQIGDFYENKLIDKPTFIARILALGYTQQDANMLVTLYEPKSPATTQQAGSPIVPRQLSESEIEELYLYGYFNQASLQSEWKSRGYSDKDALLKAYISTLQIQLPVLRAQYKNVWISESELAQAMYNMIQPFNQLGNTQEIVNNLMMTIVKNTQAERTAPEKDLTKAEILKGTKNGVLTVEQGTELLIDLGYSQSEAEYLLVLNGIVAINDPKGYWHMKQATELRKKAMGQSFIEVPNQMIELEGKLKEVNSNIEAIKTDTTKISELSKYLGEKANLEANMNLIKARFKKS